MPWTSRDGKRTFWAWSAIKAKPATPKKVGALPVGDGEAVKQTNEIGMAIPLLEALDLTGKTLTADALLTQRKLAAYLIEHQAHYVFTVKDNQPTLREALRVLFEDRPPPDHQEAPTLAHGRIEQRAIWTSTRLNDYLDFPGVGQVFAVERRVTEKKSGKTSTETVFGLTRHTPQTADAARVLAYNRGHWTIESAPQAHRGGSG